jgi:hypothetical protein
LSLYGLGDVIDNVRGNDVAVAFEHEGTMGEPECFHPGGAVRFEELEGVTYDCVRPTFARSMSRFPSRKGGGFGPKHINIVLSAAFELSTEVIKIDSIILENGD